MKSSMPTNGQMLFFYQKRRDLYFNFLLRCKLEEREQGGRENAVDNFILSFALKTRTSCQTEHQFTSSFCPVKVLIGIRFLAGVVSV